MEDAYEWKGLNGQLAYSVRDKETCFIPLLDIDECHEFENKSYAMVLKDELYDPHNSDVVVLLGGLSMPKYDVDTNELMVLVNEILKDDGKLMGVCFMNMFEKAGWLEKIDFDCVVDGTLVGVVKK